MKLLISSEAAKSVMAVMQFIGSQNTKGSGLRWFKTLENYLINIISVSKSISSCKYPPFKEMGLHCLVYKDWVIAFKNYDDRCEIIAFVYGSNLNY